MPVIDITPLKGRIFGGLIIGLIIRQRQRKPVLGHSTKEFLGRCRQRAFGRQARPTLSKRNSPQIVVERFD